jgi:tetratricopeptide (TPR) repeat protein
MVTAGVAVSALAAAGVVWWVIPPPAPGASADRRIVVAVADVVNETGEKELDVLSGLLVTSLEQSRRLAVMTQARVLDLAIRAGRKDAARVDETIGREVGKAHGAAALLLPAVRKLGSTYSLEMRALDLVHDRHLFTLSDRATSKEALLDMLDRLSARTRTELGESRAEVATASVPLGEGMTRSLDAYQHYLAGREAWLRDGQRATGLREFEEALRLDPGFAAAHGALADLLYAYDLPALAAPHGKAAGAGLDRMPEKERLLFRLKRAYASPTLEGFSREDALRLADEGLARFPDDKFVLATAAEAFESFDLPARWEPALRGALALDSGYYWAAAMFAENLGARTSEALEVARRAVATRRSPANVSILASALWAAGDEEGAVAAARETLRTEGGRHSLLALRACDVLREKGSGAECLPVWGRMVDEGLNEHERAFARARLMDGLVHQGRIHEALRLARAGPEFTAIVSPEWLARIHQVGHPRTDAPEALAAARRIANPQIRRNYLTWLGAVEEGEQITSSLGGKGYEIVEKVNRAMDLLNRGRPAGAAEILVAVREENRRRNYPSSMFGLARAHAEALLAAGRPEAASEVWPALPCRCTEILDQAGHYPSLALLRARAMEQLGRTADALRELDGVLAFWKQADRDLPLLVEARAMRRRLAAAP